MHAQDVDVTSGVSSGGLTDSEVTERLERWGYNELAEKKDNPLLKFLGYFWGPIPWMIEAALVLSAIVEHWDDFAIILLLLVANAVVGAWEEFQAGNAIAALKERLALKARVKRGGRWIQIASRELVPDDLVRLRLGDIVPADAALRPEIRWKSISPHSRANHSPSRVSRAKRFIPARSFAREKLTRL